MNAIGKISFRIGIFLVLTSFASGMYCSRTGRFLQHDPYAVKPDQIFIQNILGAHLQYENGLNLYCAFGENPLTILDAMGLRWIIDRNGGMTAKAMVIPAISFS